MTKLLCAVDSSFKQFVQSDGTVIVHLNKALYGCVRSSLLWYQTHTIRLPDGVRVCAESL